MESSEVGARLMPLRQRPRSSGLHVADAVVRSQLGDRHRRTPDPATCLLVATVIRGKAGWRSKQRLSADSGNRLARWVSRSCVGTPEVHGVTHSYHAVEPITERSSYNSAGGGATRASSHVSESHRPTGAHALLRSPRLPRQIEVAAPTSPIGVAGWAEGAGDRDRTPDLRVVTAKLLSDTLRSVPRGDQMAWASGEQMLHGEPHPGKS